MNESAEIQQTALRLMRERLADNRVPLLSIVLCAYRHSEYIEECLASINSAACSDIELIVIDDGSPDDTLDKCMKYSFHELLAFRLYTKFNSGLIDSLRSGLSIARGRYIAFMASDDKYADDGINKVLSILRFSRQRFDAILCQAAYLEGSKNSRLVYGKHTQNFFDASPQDRVRIICTEIPKPMLLQASIFDVKFLKSIGSWSDNLELDDWPTFIRIFLAESQRGAIVRYFPEILLCQYRMHAGGMHNQVDKILRITEQVASQLVPLSYRRECLANVRVDCGFVHIYEGRVIKGLILWLRGIALFASWSVILRIFYRIFRRIFRARIV